MDESTEMIFKIVIIGDAGAGKTNILSKYINNKFEQDSKATIGVELSCKTFTINKDKITAQIWDTAGQERYKSITKAYFKGALGAIIVYDVTNKVSFENIEKWISDLRNYTEPKISIILVGNKNDLENKREITKQDGETKAKDLGIPFLETSALNGNNIELVFKTLIEEVYNKCKKDFEAVAEVEIMRGKTITIEETKKQKKKCCESDSFHLIKDIKEKIKKKKDS